VMACPFCFRRMDPAHLALQCAGRGDTECAKAPDEARERLTGSTRETYPTFTPPEGRDGQAVGCPQCAGLTSRRACPQCHTALPIDFSDFKGPMIGMLGARNSGKTVLSIVLVKQLRDTTGKRFDADVEVATDDPDWRRGPSDYRAYREGPLLRDGRLPPSAVAPGAGGPWPAPPVLLSWRREVTGMARRASVRSALFSLTDTVNAGQYLSACDGLIIVVDPLPLPGARAMLGLPPAGAKPDEDAAQRAIGGITEMLRVEHNVKDSKKVPIPVAVAFSKIDALYPALGRDNPLHRAAPALPAYAEADGRAVHQQMLALLERWRAQDIDTHMRLNYADFRYFGVSALGTAPGHGTSTVAPAKMRPHRVEDPALWLLARTGIVPAR
jgi:hypothetical protein